MDAYDRVELPIVQAGMEFEEHYVWHCVILLSRTNTTAHYTRLCNTKTSGAWDFLC